MYIEKLLVDREDVILRSGNFISNVPINYEKAKDNNFLKNNGYNIYFYVPRLLILFIGVLTIRFLDICIHMISI